MRQTILWLLVLVGLSCVSPARAEFVIAKPQADASPAPKRPERRNESTTPASRQDKTQAIVPARKLSADQLWDGAATAYDRGRYPAALAGFQKSCVAGSADGCREAGNMLFDGLGTAKSPEAARDAYDAGCRLKQQESCMQLADMVRYGKGIPADHGKAALLYRAACDANGDFFSACASLGFMTYNGLGVPQDKAMAARLFRLSCLGDLNKESDEDLVTYRQKLVYSKQDMGCGNYGSLLAEGDGVARNLIVGAVFLDHACAKGLQDHCTYLDKKINESPGTLTVLRAKPLYSAACNAGNLERCYSLGILATTFNLSHGFTAEERESAYGLFLKACNGGVAAACTSYGQAFSRTGKYATDLPKARSYMERACTGGDLNGCNELALYLDREPTSGPLDQSRARALYTRACDKGWTNACYSLGWLVRNGAGGPKDEDKAVAIYARACAAGHEASCEAIGIKSK